MKTLFVIAVVGMIIGALTSCSQNLTPEQIDAIGSAVKIFVTPTK